ncbi:MAG: TSUP family transporter [Candidatus Brocadiia bacterium]
MHFPIDWYFYPILFCASIIAGLMDTVAGGGGLITLPCLILTGMDPVTALGTNKLQSSFGSFTASYKFTRAGLVDIRTAMPGIVLTMIGAVAGTIVVQNVSPDLLKMLIPWLLLGILVYVLVSPKLGDADVHPRMSPLPFYLVFGLLLGFYDGFFGPGTGSFWVIAIAMLLGYNLTKGTAYTKVMNFTSNISSLAVFLVGGKVIFIVGLAMGAGQILGAQIGAGLVIKRGAAFIRPIFITMVALMTLKLFYDIYFGQ